MRKWVRALLLIAIGSGTVFPAGCAPFNSIQWSNRSPKIESFLAAGRSVDENGRIKNPKNDPDTVVVAMTGDAAADTPTEPQNVPLVVTPGTKVILQCRAGDPDNDPLTFRWAASKGNAPGELAAAAAAGTSTGTGSSSDTTTNQPTTTKAASSRADGRNDVVEWIADSAEGIYTITCVVSDGRGGLATRVALVQVDDNVLNNPPVVTLTPQKAEVEAGKIQIFTASATDADKDTLTYAFFADKGTIAANAADPKQANYTAPSEAGEDTVYCVVTDGRGSYVTEIAKVTITAAPAAAP